MGVAKVWVYAEVDSGKPTPLTLELLTTARATGGTIEAVAFSPDAAACAGSAGAHGATRLFAAADPAYREVLIGGPAADALATLVAEHKPDLLLFGMTYDGRDVAGRLAAKLGAPVVANGLDVLVDGGISVGSSIFGATQNVTTRFDAPPPAIAIIRPKSFAAEPSGGGAAAVEAVNIPVADKHRSARVVDRVADVAAGPKLEEAP